MYLCSITEETWSLYSLYSAVAILILNPHTIFISMASARLHVLFSELYVEDIALCDFRMQPVSCSVRAHALLCSLCPVEWSAEPGGLTQVPELPGLHSEFRASLGYIERPFGKQTNKQTKGLTVNSCFPVACQIIRWFLIVNGVLKKAVSLLSCAGSEDLKGTFLPVAQLWAPGPWESIFIVFFDIVSMRNPRLFKQEACALCCVPCSFCDSTFRCTSSS